MVGPYTPVSSRLFVASGFMKWGLSGGTAAGMMLADLLGGRENPWLPAFSPTRVSPAAVPAWGRMNLHVGSDMVGDRFQSGQANSAEDIPRGQARIARDGTELTVSTG